MASYDPKAILGAQLETLATDIAKDIAYKDAYAGKWIGIARTATTTVNNAVYWPLFSFTRSNDYFSLQLEVDVTNGAFDTNVFETKIIDLGGYTQGGVEWANEIRICHKRVYSTRGYGNVLYYTMSNNVVTVYIKSACRANETQFCRLNKVLSQNSITNLTWYSVDTPPEQPSSPTKFTEVLGGMRVDVSSYTTYASILAVVNAGGLPYYHYTSGNTAIDLTFAGTRAVPNVGMVLEFNAVQDNTIYYVGFAGSSSSFGTVRTFPLFSSDNVKTSSDTSSWSSDNTNVPTRAAVDAKISDAISGDLGGFRWSATVQQSNNAIANPSFSFKKGDWFNVTDSGTLTYYANNDRSDIRTIQLYAGDDVYWTTNGTLSRKPSTAVQIFDMSVLSDWNDLTSSGLYQISVSGATRAPAAGSFSCLVSNENGNIRQVAFNSTNIYYRGKASSGQAWTDWKNVNDVDHATSADTATSATNYISGSSTYNIANAINSKQGTLHFISSNAGTLENPVADRQYVDGLVGGGWVFATAGVWKKYTDGSSVLAQYGSYSYLDELVVKAAYARRIQVLSDSLPNATMSPGYTQEYEGARHQWTQHVRYALTLTNTTDVACNIYIICGGRFTTSNADASTLHNFAGNLYIDGRLYSTPTATVMIQTWGPGDVNKQAIGTIAAYSSRTWEIWWEDYVDPQNPSGYHIHSVYVNTCI